VVEEFFFIKGEGEEESLLPKDFKEDPEFCVFN